MNRKRVLVLNRIDHRHYVAAGRSIVDPDRYATTFVTLQSRADTIPSGDYEQLHAFEDFDEEAVVDLAAALHARDPFAAVVAVSELDVLPAATIRSRLGIPGMAQPQALLFRDKVAMKTALAEAGIPVPEFSAPVTGRDVVDFVATHGRSVVKPRLGLGSEDTVVLADRKEAERWADSHASRIHLFDVERFVPGDMYHCDAVTVDGTVVLASVGRYLESTLSYRHGHVLSSVMEDSEIADRIVELNGAVLSALGLTDGVTHLEAFHDGSRLTFCEVGARPGGAGVIPSVRAAYGLDLLHTAVRVQIGEAVPDIPRARQQLAAWLLFHRVPGRVRDVSSAADFPEPWISHAKFYVTPGQELDGAEHSTDSAAQFVVTAPDRAGLLRRVDDVRERFRLVVE